MTKTLTNTELEQLRTFLESIESRLDTSELSEINRIKALLGLPLKAREDRSSDPEPEVSLRADMARQGVEHSTQRNKRTAAEREARTRRS